ncbi:hypothetical protein X768_17625 [Mesorhizobium sp. LSJC265A00]|uniref:hypothetical protein n=1 Tax=unclassified Mesorhizobium TaxID=325217 RepID=UPI0003CE2DA0|nr:MULTISPECIES: hypothetical protein [unclassified Mesorhizobium]ESX09773.1 hypothetical protein X768_17625 [Mesorhizobium sp. LSJC265A00]WJI44776.1 hypothetical protein NL532_30170 [Mesorhizobium sp. C120A]
MLELKIAKIEVFQVDLPYSGGVYQLSRGREYRTFDATIVRMTTHNGLEGWGESTPFGANYAAAHALGVRSGIAEIAPSLIGLDPIRVDRINDAMDAALIGHEHAKTALDVACWDLFGKSVDLPVCELLGDAQTSECRSYHQSTWANPTTCGGVSRSTGRSGISAIRLKSEASLVKTRLGLRLHLQTKNPASIL